jgi:putative glutamine amidotransferase
LPWVWPGSGLLARPAFDAAKRVRPEGQTLRSCDSDGVSRKPIIGITTYAQNARWGAWDLPAALVPLDYVTAVERAGGRPLLVPPTDDDVADTLDVLDGVVFSGGADIGPGTYGAEPHPETEEPQARRDRAEMALLAAALERDVPTLAICRGFQLLNVVRGGDLVQHLPEAVGDEKHRQVRGVFSEHPVEVKGGTQLAAVLGERQPAVKSSHHQGVQRVGDGLIETAWAEDGTLEGLEDPSRRFALGVLWHPEAGDDQRLFDALVEEARTYRAERESSRGETVDSARSSSS